MVLALENEGHKISDSSGDVRGAVGERAVRTDQDLVLGLLYILCISSNSSI